MNLLIWPALRPGDGTGHIRRCAALCLDLHAYLYLPETDNEKRRAYAGLAPLIEGISRDRIITDISALESGAWDLIILDRRISDRESVKNLAARYQVIGIDEGSAYARTVLPYLIDTLPLPGRYGRANYASSSLLPLPEAENSGSAGYESTGIRRVLVTFGGEDREGLGGRFLRWLEKSRFLPEAAITHVRGVFDGKGRDIGVRPAAETPHGRSIRISPEIPNLKSVLGGYDLVITKFGLTAYEAVQSGCAVLLLNPERYHKKLSRIAGFPEIGVRRVRTRSCSAYLREMTHDPRAFAGRLEPIRVKKLERLADFIGSLDMPGRAPLCPVCAHAPNPVLRRFREKTYCFCSRCGVVYRIRYAGGVSDYGEEYFFDSYKQQYGKTYLEDFDHIMGIAGPRLEAVRSLLKIPGRMLLDVGCAYGPFLKAAGEKGFTPRGFDVSASAVEYVRNSLRIPADCGDFASAETYLPGTFDVITMWYVIEHFEELGDVLAKVNRLLKKGGVFGFSSPNCLGISGILNPGSFFERSPMDHAAVLYPSGTRRLLKRFGFALRKVRVTGHHPERFPRRPAALMRVFLLAACVRLFPGRAIPRNILRRGAAAGRKKPILETGAAGSSMRAGAGLSRLMRLGDTFEAYAVKLRDAD